MQQRPLDSLLPGGFGRRLLPTLVDEIATSDPHRPIFSLPRENDPTRGFEDVSMRSFARVVDRLAWFLQESLGSSGWDQEKKFPTLLYMGPQDPMYAALVLAANKTGYKMLLSSPRNTLEAHLSLLEKTECDVFLMPPAFPLPIVKQILTTRPMKAIEVSSFQHWLVYSKPAEQHRPYPYTKTYEEAYLEPFVVVHTSGSTGLPKPIIQAHGTASTLDAHNALPLMGMSPAYPSLALCSGKRVYMTFPLFHTGGLFMILPGAVYCNFTTVLGSFPPSVDTINAVHVHGNVNQSTLAPMMVVELIKSPEYLDNLSRLESVSSGGGPLPKTVGDLVTTKTSLFMGLGSTECGLFPVLKPKDPLDWNYMNLSPVLGQEYRHVSDDLFEQVIVRKPQLEPFQGVFATFPDLQEYRMKDLYSKHPTKDDDIWLYRGRIDDIIVYSTGEKLNPLEMEGIINGHSAVSAALITGLGRFQSALLVEAAKPPATETEKQETLDVIWPSVEAANEKCSSFGRIHRTMVAFTTADKPMLRAGKGTVQRRLTTDLYASELDALYEANDKTDSVSPINGALGEIHIEDAIKGIIKSSADIDSATISTSADLFELGLDSLQVTVISKQINKLLSSFDRNHVCDARTVYANPTVAKLTSTITAIVMGQRSSPDIPSSPGERMNRLYAQLSADIPLSVRTPLSPPSDKFVVLLTGSTGSVGSYILTCLDQDPRISRIYCLNRGPASQARQKDSLAAKGLRLTCPDKITYLDADITKSRFGLSVQEHLQLLSEVTDVIHNAWQVDFNLSVESFLGHLLAVRRFIDFSSHSAFGAHILFVSSVSAVGGLRTWENIPESMFGDDWSVPEPMGYGQSKYIAERLLHAAAAEAGIPTTICRVGQVAGPTTESGIWTQREWLPSLVKSSKAMGKLPTSLGRMETVDWVPVDVLGQAVVELVTTSSNLRTQGALIYHLVNPQQATWASLMPTVVEFLGVDVEAVSLQAWVEALRESASETKLDDLSLNPAIKLLLFFESLVDIRSMPSLLDTSGATGASKALASLKPVGGEWMSNWMRQWGY